jgi:mono/diheme cytochrome c family protein
MMKFGLVSVVIVFMMFAMTACGRNREDAAPTPTAIPVIEVDADNADGDAASASAASEVSGSESVETDEADSVETEAPASTESGTAAGQGQQGRGSGMMGGGNGGMMRSMGPQMRERHMAPIPAEYAGLTSPVAADADSLAQGKAHFDLFCASCHGNEGLGDGPAAEALDPAPPMLAQTALMTGDDYLFWRISEGGAMEPFNSAMPLWKEILDEQARWDIINYARSLGGMHGNAGGGAMREEMQATMQAEMLTSALDLGVIDQDEADVFMDVHGRLDTYRASLGDAFTGNMDEMQDELLAGMVEGGELTQEEADAFAEIHARLDEAGVMP